MRPLTERQERALFLIETARPGISSEELGAALHPHGPDRRCEWCVKGGREVGGALKKKGLVRQVVRDGRRLWAGLKEIPDPDRYDPESADFPEGF